MATIGPGDIDLTMHELRVVARFAVESAEEVLPLFETCHPDDGRPRAAVDAAWTFVRGAERSNLQRVAALDAHRAAKRATADTAAHAARAAGDAAAAAYLHPLARATQVGHILRAAAHAARAIELAGDDDQGRGERHIEQARRRATPTLVEVLGRYPPAPTGRSRVAQLMTALDTALRTPRTEQHMTGSWTTRAETDTDAAAVRAINLAAFDTAAEADLVDALRADAGWIPGLSLLSVDGDGTPVGHALLTRCHIGDVPALCLAPCAVRPAFQRTGAGSAAITAGLDAARAMGERFVVVLGHPAYYPRFGFARASAHGISLSVEVPDEALMSLALDGGPLPAGQVRYAAPFGI